MKKLNYKHVAYTIICFIIIVGLVVFGISRLTLKDEENINTKTNTTTISNNKNEDVSITISAAGDCTLGTDPRFNYATSLNAMYTKQGPEYFLSKVKSVFEKDDMTLVNFEGTLTQRTTRADKTFTFKGDDNYLEILTKGSVEAVSFANNHCRDFGEGSYQDTIKVFKKYNMIYSSFSTVGTYKVKGKTIGMVSVFGSSAKNDIQSGIKSLKKKNVDIIIVSMHVGVEKSNYPNANQKTLAHLAVDEGADLVLGHHPHVLQGIEKYKGVYINYSLANFCFGGNKNPSDKDTLIFQKTFNFKNGQLVQDDAIKVIPCSVSSVSNRNNYQPVVLEGTQKTRVMKRINTYSSSFNVKFDSEGEIES